MGVTECGKKMIREEVLLVKDYWHFNRLLQRSVRYTFDVVI